MFKLLAALRRPYLRGTGKRRRQQEIDDTRHANGSRQSGVMSCAATGLGPRVCAGLAIAGMVVLGAVTAVTGGWGVLALAYCGPADELLRTALATAFGIAALVALIALGLRRWRWRVLAAYVGLFGVLLTWWGSLIPSNEGDWQADVAVLPYATRENDIVTVHNIRNFDYRSETDFTPSWYDQRFDVDKLEGVDLVAVYWMGPAIAHTFVSFAFAGGEHLAISIETRKRKGQGYSTLGGFFRQYEIIYVVADERDVIRLRTNYRHDPPEDVYVYRVRAPLESIRRVFLEYMRQIDELRDSPEFYNTLTSNCTTAIWFHTLVLDQHLPFSWKILASGYVPEYLYEAGRLDTRLPFAELQWRAHVNARAQAADAAVDFSRRIREPDPAERASASAVGAAGRIPSREMIVDAAVLDAAGGESR